MAEVEPSVCGGCGRAGFREEGYGPRATCVRCGGQMLVATWDEWDAAHDARGVEGISTFLLAPGGITEHRFVPRKAPAGSAEDDPPGELRIEVVFDPPKDEAYGE